MRIESDRAREAIFDMDEHQSDLDSGDPTGESLAAEIVSALKTARRDLRKVSLEEVKLWMVCAGRVRRRAMRELSNELMPSR